MKNKNMYGKTEAHTSEWGQAAQNRDIKHKKKTI
jgi:hypothetical protein